MKKILIVLIFLAGILLSGCDKQKALIFFSSKPITQQNFSVETSETYFNTGNKIYFVLLNPKPFMSNILRIQVLKTDEKPPLFNFSIAQARDVEIDMSKQYYTDYFCLHSAGYYVLRIFSRDNLNKPIAEADFKVDAR